MKSKYFFHKASLIFLFTLSMFLVAQENEMYYIDQDNIPELENRSGDFIQPTFSPDAGFYKTAVSDFRVNEQIGNSRKLYINSAINDNGISLIVWYDYREGSQNVYAQLVNSSGQVVGENIKVNAPEDGNTYNYPDVAVNDDNQFLVVWSEFRSGYSIYGQILEENGSMVGENFEIDDENNNVFKYQTCIASKGDELIVAWLDSRGGSNYDIYAQRLNKDGSKIGENFIVNADSQGVRKNLPDVSIKNDGSFLATWYASVDGSNNIYAVSLNADNNIVGDQFQVSDLQSELANNRRSVTSDYNSGYLVTWDRYMNNDYNIVAQLLDSSITKIDSNFIVNDDLKSSQLYPSIDSDSSGNTTITWYDYRNGYAQLYAQKFENDSLIAENIKISEDEMTGNKSNVSCSVNNNGQLITAWLDLNEPTEYRIYSRMFEKNNTPVSASIRIDNDNYSSTEQNPSIVAFEDGTEIIAWTDQRNRTYNTFFQRYDADGNPLGVNTQVNSNTAQYDTKVTKLKDQNFLILWREYFRGANNQNEIVAQKHFKTGESLGEKIIISSNEIKGNAGNFDASSNFNGDFAVAFQKRVNGFYRIYAQKYNSDGTAIGENILVSNDSTSSFYKPKVALDSLGNFAISYYGNIGSGNDIFLNRYKSDGTEIDSVITVNDDESLSYQYNPDIAINQNGECIITWFGYRTISGVYVQKYKNIGLEDSFEKIDSNIAVADYNISFCSPSVSLNNNGEYAISWTELNNSFNDLKFRLFDSQQMPISEILYATENQERNQINQDIYFIGDKIYNVWQDNHEIGIGYDIWANVFDYQDLVTEVDENRIGIAKEFNLSQNYPNPFNPSTTIKYSVPNVATSHDLSLHNIQLKVFDVLGREIRTLVNEKQNQGDYEVTFEANKLTSGIYFYSLKIGEFVQTKKMILLK